MESLKKFEEHQIILQSLQSRGIITASTGGPSDHDSDRFLAQFVIFLSMPCGEVDVGKKFHLISEYMAKLPTEFLKEASVWLHGEGSQKDATNERFTPTCEDRTDACPLQSSSERMAMVSLDAMERANSTLEDFQCRTYFLFHDMDMNMPQSVFRFLPMLSFTESYIYQLDTLNEEMLRVPNVKVDTLGGIPEKTNQSWIINSMKAFINDPFRPLILILDNRGLLTPRVREELASGEEYWALERKLCHALIRKEEVLIEDVMRAIHLKSFDYRVLNLLLYQLRGVNVNELHMEFLSLSEFLVEVSDDLFDYEDDVLENNFNVLRMFVGIYGVSNAPPMLAKCIAEAEDRYENLVKALDPELSSKYTRRCEEATRDGGKVWGHPLGTWTIPQVIADEELYRSKLTWARNSI